MCPGQSEISEAQGTPKYRTAFFALFCALVLSNTAFGNQQAGGAQAAGAKVRMIRSVAGTKGETRGGTYVVLDPRTTFYVPDDRQVIVYFEWEAAKGTHHCEGTVKGPNGQLAVMSSFDYPATLAKFGGAGTGFFVEDGSFVTAFRVIEGAYSLRIQNADGTRIQTDNVVAWNRRQDWVILKLEGGKHAALRVADPKSWSIGDHCYWLDTKNDSDRVISDGQIVGKESREGWGERISISNIFNRSAMGGPLLNERGEVIGLLGGALPESLVLQIMRDTLAESSGGATYTITASAIPMVLVLSRSNATSSTLRTLWASGQFMAPVTAPRNVAIGMLTQGKPTRGGTPFAKEMKHEFTRQDDTATVFVALQSIETLKSTVQLRMYDADNHVVSSGEPVRITLRRGETSERSWSFSPGSLHPGVYRADVMLGDAVAWRTYLRVKE